MQCGPRPVPSVELDRGYSDLFRVESLEGLEAGSVAGVERWRRFLAAGIGRLAAVEERRELAQILERLADLERRAPQDAKTRSQLLDAVAECARQAVRLARTAAGQVVPEVRVAGGAVVGRLRQEVDRIRAMARPDDRQQDAADAYPAGGSRDLWKALIRDGRYLRRGDGRVEHRPGPVSLSLPLQVPDEVLLLDSGRGGVLAYHEFLRAAGTALTWSHLPRGLAAEDRHLPADAGAAVYGALMASRLREPAWLQHHGLAPSQVERLTKLAREHWARRLLGLLEMVEEENGGTPMAPPYWSAAPPEPGPLAVMAAACEVPGAGLELEAECLSCLLEDYLRCRFGRLWSEHPGAAALLRDLWSVGWGRSTAELLSSVGLEDPDGQVLVEELRQPR